MSIRMRSGCREIASCMTWFPVVASPRTCISGTDSSNTPSPSRQRGWPSAISRRIGSIASLLSYPLTSRAGQSFSPDTQECPCAPHLFSPLAPENALPQFLAFFLPARLFHDHCTSEWSLCPYFFATVVPFGGEH